MHRCRTASLFFVLVFTFSVCRNKCWILFYLFIYFLLTSSFQRTISTTHLLPEVSLKGRWLQTPSKHINSTVYHTGQVGNCRETLAANHLPTFYGKNTLYAKLCELFAIGWINNLLRIAYLNVNVVKDLNRRIRHTKICGIVFDGVRNKGHQTSLEFKEKRIFWCVRILAT